MALFFTVLLGVSVSILGYFIASFNHSRLIRGVEARFDADIRAIQDRSEMTPFMDLSEVLKRYQYSHPHTYFSVQNARGDYVYGDFHPDDSEVSVLKEGIVVMELTANDVTSASFQGTRRFAAKVQTLSDGSRILVATDLEDALRDRDRMQLLGLLTILLMLIVICASFLISTFVVNRLNTIWQTARTIIDTGDLSKRIEVTTEWDDLGKLTVVLNELLERIEVLMQSVRQVSDNIAHDLRTPLARLRSHMEELDLLIDTRGDIEGHEITQSLIQEADQLLRTFNALLRIARIESGKIEQEFSSVDLSELLEDVLELYQPLAEEKAVTVDADLTNVMTYGDRDMLFQLFANLLDNAVKFTPENGFVYVSARQVDDESVEIRIQDSGPGISDDDKKRIFIRFYRAEESRSSAGDGLGLSLVSAVLTLHKGSIDVVDSLPGTSFRVRLMAWKHDNPVIVTTN